MKKYFFVISFALLLLLPGCGAAQREASSVVSQADNTMTVRYDPCKYGDGWIRETVRLYQAENPTVKIRLISDSNILQSMATAFHDTDRLPDLALMPATNWQEYASKGWLDDLTPVARTKVGDKTVADRVVPGLRSFGRMNGKYFALPLCDGVSGIFYNAGMFEKFGWSVPQTASELLLLLPEITSKNIAPFAWAGREPSCWDGVVNAWWAQYEGAASMKTFLAMKSPEVYRKAGRLQALSLFETIVADSANSVKHADTLDTPSAFQALVSGRAAMMPGGAWVASKYASQIPKEFRLGMMKPPAIDGAKEPQYLDTEAGDFICIPANAAHRSLAENFACFLAGNEVSSLFYQDTGVPSAFNGFPDELFSLESAISTASPVSAVSEPSDSGTENLFAQNVFELYTKSPKLYLFSGKACYYSHFLNWPGSGEPYLSIYQGDTTAQQVFDGDAAYAQNNWAAANSTVSP